jgi:hypothetical protein
VRNFCKFTAAPVVSVSVAESSLAIVGERGCCAAALLAQAAEQNLTGSLRIIGTA